MPTETAAHSVESLPAESAPPTQKMSLPTSGGVNVVPSLLRRYPGLRVVVLSVHDEQVALSQALGAGAAGFVLKRTAALDLTAAVDAVLRGETYVSPALGRRPKSEGQE